MAPQRSTTLRCFRTSAQAGEAMQSWLTISSLAARKGRQLLNPLRIADCAGDSGGCDGARRSGGMRNSSPAPPSASSKPMESQRVVTPAILTNPQRSNRPRRRQHAKTRGRRWRRHHFAGGRQRRASCQCRRRLIARPGVGQPSGVSWAALLTAAVESGLSSRSRQQLPRLQQDAGRERGNGSWVEIQRHGSGSTGDASSSGPAGLSGNERER